MSSQGQDPFTRQYNPFAAPETNDFAVATETGQAPLGGRLARLGAAILDGILMIPVVLVVVVVMYGGDFTAIAEGRAAADGSELMATLFGGVAGLIWYLILNGYLLANRGQTIGKLAAGVRIVDFQTGEKVSFGRIFGLRYCVMQLIYLIPYVGNLIALVGILLIFRSSRRCLHDEIAGTKVVAVS